MKKLFLSSALLLSCVLRAENAPENISPESITFENSVCQDIKGDCATQSNSGQENAKQENVAAQQVAPEKVSKTIKINLESVSENCDSIVFTFKINKNKNCEDKQAWAKTIAEVADLIDSAESANNNSEEDINKILNQSYDFLKNCSKSDACTGVYSINLNMPEDIAKLIFAR